MEVDWAITYLIMTRKNGVIEIFVITKTAQELTSKESLSRE